MREDHCCCHAAKSHVPFPRVFHGYRSIYIIQINALAEHGASRFSLSSGLLGVCWRDFALRACNFRDRGDVDASMKRRDDARRREDRGTVCTTLVLPDDWRDRDRATKSLGVPLHRSISSPDSAVPVGVGVGNGAGGLWNVFDISRNSVPREPSPHSVVRDASLFFWFSFSIPIDWFRTELLKKKKKWIFQFSIVFFCILSHNIQCSNDSSSSSSSSSSRNEKYSSFEPAAAPSSRLALFALQNVALVSFSYLDFRCT